VDLGRANPPFHLVEKFLRKVISDRATILCCLPLWKTRRWYRLLCQIPSDPWLILGEKMFRDVWGIDLPPPRWKCLVTVLRGSEMTSLQIPC
jgi:hypothetical protein